MKFFDNLKENFNSKTEILEGTDASASFDFDNLCGSVDSYILRHIYNNTPLHTGLTLELFKEGHLKLILPFNIYNKTTLNNEYDSLIYYDYFITEELENLRIIDLAESMFAFQVLLSKYKKLLNEYNCNYNLNIKYKFNNFNSTTPFMDSKEYMEFIYENKLPINLKTTINIPDRGYLNCPFNDFNIISFTIKIIEATGLSRHLIDVISKGYGKYFKIKSKNNKVED